MSNLTLAIGGRSFTIACADGEESHIETLGRLIDEKVSASGATGQTESRMLLYAALMLADEVVDLQKRTNGDAQSPELAQHLTRLAQRFENLADILEAGAQNA